MHGSEGVDALLAIVLVLLALGVGELLLERGELLLQARKLLLLLVLLGLAPHLLFDGLELLGLLGERELFFSIDLLLHEHHVLLQLLVLGPVIISLLVRVVHLGLELYHLD